VAAYRDRVTAVVGHHGAARAVLAVANGFFGDRLNDAGSRLRYPMTLRHRGGEVPLTDEGIHAACPQATGTVALFLHGFVMSERGWDRRGPEPEQAASYGERLEADLGMTPLRVLYNTGLRVSTNGSLLVGLLDTLTRIWPVPLERIVLVGHSMGGLVAHSALAQAGDGGWVDLVSDTVALGTPHHGAPLEKAVAHAVVAMGSWERTAPVATVVKRRSVGTKDLRHGNLVEDDWLGHDPDDVRNRRIDIPLRPGIRHLAVVGVLSADPDSVVAALGDGMVTRSSARGQRRGHDNGRRYADEDVVVLGSLGHLALLNHPAVYAVLRDRLAAGGPVSEPGPAAP
ncbi:MAG TPA: hypothetical protein VIK12_06110, partial [Pengzhenrongella sp.]